MSVLRIHANLNRWGLLLRGYTMKTFIFTVGILIYVLIYQCILYGIGHVEKTLHGKYFCKIA